MVLWPSSKDINLDKANLLFKRYNKFSRIATMEALKKELTKNK